MVMSLIANRFRLVTDFAKPVRNCFSKAAWELQTGFLKLMGATNRFSEAHGSYKQVF